MMTNDEKVELYEATMMRCYGTHPMTRLKQALVTSGYWHERVCDDDDECSCEADLY